MCTWILLTSLFASSAFANSQFVSNDIARGEKGKVAYQERHSLEISEQGEILEATTEYKRENGENFAKIHMNFARSAAVPEFTFEDSRSGLANGVEFDGQKYTLWRSGKDKKKERVEYPVSKFNKDELVVTSQGLHYHLIKNFGILNSKKDIVVKFLAPDKLDFFTFILGVEKEDEKNLYLVMKIKSFLLRGVISPIKMTYRKADKRLTYFSGLSPIPTDSGAAQDVTIEYN